jgi:HEAT repeat protein
MQGGFMRVVLAALLLSFALVGCKSDPSTVEHWEKRIAEGKGKKEKIKAVEDLRTSKYLTPAMLPMLQKRLEAEKAPEVKTAIARVLGEQKNPSSLEALSNAIEPAASDSETRALNKELATAFGTIGDVKAVPSLIKLLKTKDNYTVIAAIEALGALQSKDAFEPLLDIATDDAIEQFITKKAIEALGEIGDARAVPTLIKAMVKERKGVSFYRESSYALYKLGTPAADALVPVVEGKDKALFEWAANNNIKDIALYLKATQVVGDLHDLRAEKTIVGFLNFKSEFDDIKDLYRMRAADALGRMRSKDAVKPLAALLDEANANARQQYVWALARIGSKDALPRLLETAGKGPWDARDESMRGLAMLGDDTAPFEKFIANEQKAFEAECKDDEGQTACKDVPGSVAKHVEKMKSYMARATAGKECKSDAVCWAKKLDDKNEGVRERAAYEVGRGGNASLINELMKRMREKNLDTRLAFIQGADWLVHDSKEALAEAKKGLPELNKQIEDERGKTEFDKVNEDLKRLHVKLEH